ncbi:hypothetical protein QUF72_12300 [Desulfobacterales bacterium HSG2]|nr:hypothetical protein [Desulfobacterales bacterium HSG2]
MPSYPRSMPLLFQRQIVADNICLERDGLKGHPQPARYVRLGKENTFRETGGIL